MIQPFEEYLQDLRIKFQDVRTVHAESIELEQYLLLDIREKAEFDVSSIPGAVWAGYDQFDISTLDSVERGKQILVYCSVGYRSSIIAHRLDSAGFMNVYNLFGGIFKWANDGKILHREGKVVNQVHGYNQKWSLYITNPFLEIIF